MSKVTVLSGLSHSDRVPTYWHFGSRRAQRLSGVQQTTRRLSRLHVLSGAGFVKSYPFKGSSDGDVDPQPSKYRDPLSPILDHILLIMILDPKLLTMCWMPKAWSRVSQAVFDFKAYMTEILVEEKHHIEQGKPTTGDLVASLNLHIWTSKPRRRH